MVPIIQYSYSSHINIMYNVQNMNIILQNAEVIAYLDIQCSHIYI